MVDFIYEPWKTIIIHEIVQYDLQTLVDRHSIGVASGQLGRAINWANGIAFRHTSMPPTEEVIEEQLEGRIHWSHLSFAFMPKHQPMIIVKEGNIRIPIIDVSDNLLFKELAEWLRERYKPK